MIALSVDNTASLLANHAGGGVNLDFDFTFVIQMVAFSTLVIILKPILFEPGDSMVATRSLTAEGASHDPMSSLHFTRVVLSKRSHHALLSSPEMLAALVEVLK